MEINTLRSMTTELCGRSINPAIEAHLTQYVQEVTGVLTVVRAAAQTFPDDLAPAAVFYLKPESPDK